MMEQEISAFLRLKIAQTDIKTTEEKLSNVLQMTTAVMTDSRTMEGVMCAFL